MHVAGHGPVLITGCGRSGLQRLATRAESLYGQPVVGVVGGLHYGNATTDEVQPRIQFLQSCPISLLALTPHDSGPEALAASERAFPGVHRTLKVREAIHFPR